MSNYAPDVQEFDAVNSLQYIVGIDGPRKRADEWFAAYQGPISYQVRDLNITAGSDIAFCHFLYHISGTMTNGQEVDMWLRATLGCQKLDGKWLVTHEHSSVPFDVGSGKASLELKP
jgi:ketosteroid isomerase-like protein